MNESPAHHKPITLGQLKATGWRSKTVKQEMHDSLLAKLSQREKLFPGIIGYDDTVIPEISLALLAKHDMLFLGEKGQAKSRLMRSLVQFLDPEVPYLAGTELHDDPLCPISAEGNRLITEMGDDAPIDWCSSAHSDFHFHILARDPYSIGDHVLLCGRPHGFARFDVEDSLMPRADHFIAVDKTLAERSFVVCARIVDGIELPVHIEHRYAFSLYFDAFALVVGDL